MQQTAREGRQGLAALTLGAIGVVYGDIGTSPLYTDEGDLRRRPPACRVEPTAHLVGAVSCGRSGR